MSLDRLIHFVSLMGNIRKCVIFYTLCRLVAILLTKSLDVKFDTLN